MTQVARKLLDEVLGLPEDERVEIAAELLASLDGPADADWDATWLAELDRRARAAEDRDEAAPEWAEVRAEILDELRRR